MTQDPNGAKSLDDEEARLAEATQARRAFDAARANFETRVSSEPPSEVFDVERREGVNPADTENLQETQPVAEGEAGDGMNGTDSNTELNEELANVQEARIAELTEELARANAAYYNKDQEFANYVRRAKADIPTHRDAGIAEVIEALMSVLDDLDLAEQHGDLVGPFKSVATKLEDTLEARFGVKRFGRPGDLFDPTVHSAIATDESGEGPDTIIHQVAQPGYMFRDRALRPAIVIVGQGKAQAAVPVAEETEGVGNNEGS
ncbi:MAG: nucleotide exchange factor GrpE [Actinomycetaceae bacterium]|nr:nucleotide exchange factor GrpE [Actinomycetaceae bacterium]